MVSNTKTTIPELCNYLHIASFLGLALVCFTRTYTGRSQWGKVDFSPILKHTGVKPSGALPSYSDQLRRKTRRRLAARRQTPSGRRRVWHGVCQMAIYSTPSARRRVAGAICQAVSGRRVVWQTPSGRGPSARRHLPDGRLPDAVCQTLRLPEGRLPDTASGRRCLMAVWQVAVYQTPSAR